MTQDEVTVLVATTRMGGQASLLLADTLLDVGVKDRPLVLAKALAAGRNGEMVKLITAGGVSEKLVVWAKERSCSI